MSTTIIQTDGITKQYDEQEVLKGISIKIHKGELFTLLGPNGAGKTTLMKILTGQIRPTSGEAKVLGVNINDLLKSDKKLKISYVPQELLIWDNLTVEENINLAGKVYGLGKDELNKKVESLLKDFDLWQHKKKYAVKLSGGMKRKLSLAMSLMNDPELLFLDEPTTGLDVESRTLLIEDLKRLKEKGMTVFLTTHLMEEAESLSTRVLIINKGQIVALGSVNELIDKYVGKKVLQIGLLNNEESFQKFLNENIKQNPSLTYLKIKSTFFIKGENITELMHEITSNQEFMDSIFEIYIKNGSLKETFLFITHKLYESSTISKSMEKN